MENNKDKGYVWLPYITKTTKTTIDGETVWYDNKWKNLLFKIKHFFIKPKYLKNAHVYKNKAINNSFYGVVKVTGDKEVGFCICGNQTDSRFYDNDKKTIDCVDCGKQIRLK